MTKQALQAENAELKRRLEELEETIRAIQGGAVDAFVVAEGAGQRVYTLEGADRPYRLLVEEMQQGAATLHHDGTIIYSNRRLAELLDISHQKLVGGSLREFVVGDDRLVLDELLKTSQIGSGKAEIMLRRSNGEHVPTFLTCNALPEECGAAIGVLVTDLTSQRHHEHLKFLIDELNHRVKNTLASVQGIAQQTLRNTGNAEAFAISFNGRIQALARVHTMLSQSTWRGADLAALLHDQVLLGAIDETRLTVRGPSVMLEPQLALHLAMVVHELGNNSYKYGALSSATGRVAISWTIDGGLRLQWVERGGPPVSVPERRGFGSQFILQSVQAHQGSARMIPDVEGVTWLIDLPLPAPRSQPAQQLVLSMRGATPQGAPTDRHRDKSIEGKRVLVVEDEVLVAMDLVDILERAAVEPVGPANSAADAIRQIETEELDAALVDANLHGKPVDDVVAALARRNVPFAFVTGYDRGNLPRSFQDADMISKPFTSASVLAMVRKISGGPSVVERDAGAERVVAARAAT